MPKLAPISKDNNPTFNFDKNDTDDSFFRIFNEQKVTILAEFQILSHDEAWVKKVHSKCEIVEANVNGIRIQKWVQGRIKYGRGNKPTFYHKKHTSSYHSVTLDSKNRELSTYVVKFIRVGWT